MSFPSPANGTFNHRQYCARVSAAMNIGRMRYKNTHLAINRLRGERGRDVQYEPRRERHPLHPAPFLLFPILLRLLIAHRALPLDLGHLHLRLHAARQVYRSFTKEAGDIRIARLRIVLRADFETAVQPELDVRGRARGNREDRLAHRVRVGLRAGERRALRHHPNDERELGKEREGIDVWDRQLPEDASGVFQLEYGVNGE